MTLSDDIKSTLEANAPLMELLTGGIFNNIEEISKQSAKDAFDEFKEILPCALIKFPNEIPAGPYLTSVRTSFVIYFYQYSGYSIIEPAMGMAFEILNEMKIGSKVWNIEFNNAVYQQRDQALDCPLGTLRFSAVRRL